MPTCLVTDAETAKADKLEVGNAIKMLIAGVKSLANEMGCPIIFTSSIHPGLIRTLKKSGFKVNDTNVTHLLLGEVE